MDTTTKRMILLCKKTGNTRNERESKTDRQTETVRERERQRERERETDRQTVRRTDIEGKRLRERKKIMK